MAPKYVAVDEVFELLHWKAVSYRVANSPGRVRLLGQGESKIEMIDPQSN